MMLTYRILLTLRRTHFFVMHKAYTYFGHLLEIDQSRAYYVNTVSKLQAFQITKKSK